MKTALLFAACTVAAHLCLAQSACEPPVALNQKYSKAATLDSVLQHYTTPGLPGAAMAVYTEAEGWWAGAKGFADVEKKITMDNCHLQYLQSISKTYMAVAILLLKEQGKIDIDAAITKYLPARYSKYIKNASAITVKMLLNQNSGVPEYNSNPQFLSQVMQHPLKNFSAEDCLKSIANEPPQFVPGAKYMYTNTNYLLLALIGDAITGDHAAFIKSNVLKPLGLNDTYYGNGHNYLQKLKVPESYWDVLNTGRPVNITQFQQMTVVSSKGDDGIVCTPLDAIKFLKGLMEGKILQPQSLDLMLNFVKDEKGNKRYGMGMIYFDLGGIEAYGHGGGGVGAGCGLLYIPARKTYVFFSTNLGVLVENDLVKKADEMKTAILTTILQ